MYISGWLKKFGPAQNILEPFKRTRLKRLSSEGLETKIQQTKMLVTCQRFGDLFLFGLV